MQTHDFGKAFFHLINVRPGTELVHLADFAQEIEPPFRSARPVVIRLFPFRKAVVIGWWRNTNMGEEQALLKAVSGWSAPIGAEVDLENDEVRATIRDNVAKQGLDPDSEWTIISALGVA